MEKAPLGTTAEYNRPSGTVRTEVGRQIESGSVGKHEWGFGKRGLGMTQEGLGTLPGLGIRAGRAVVRWNKASRLMRRKTSTDMVNLNLNPTLQYCKGVGRVVNHKGGTSLTKKATDGS
jgi:hypothetical protein